MKSKKLQGCVFKSGTWSYRRRLRGKAAEILGKQNLIFPLSSDTRVAEQLAPKARQKADEIVRRAERGEGDLELALRLREDYHEAIDYDPIYEEWESKHGYPKALQLAKVVQGRSTPLEVGLEQRLRHDPLGSAAEADTRQALRELQETTGVWSIEEVTRAKAREFLEHLLRQPRARSTSLKLLQKLRALWGHFVNHELATENVFFVQPEGGLLVLLGLLGLLDFEGLRRRATGFPNGPHARCPGAELWGPLGGT